MASTFGHLFRITTWGESHGGGVGVVVDGCPPRLKLTEADIQPDLDRRRPGQSQNRLAAQGIRHGANPFRHVRRQNARHADLPVGQKRGRPARSLRGNEDEVPPFARGLHLLRQIRHPQLAGRRPRQRARNGRTRRRRRDCEKNSARAVRRRNPRLRQTSPATRRGREPGQGEVQRRRVEHRSLPRHDRRRTK